MNEADLKQRPVDDAKGRIEHPLPGEGRQHRWNNERQKNKRAGESFALEIPVQEKRQPQAQGELEDARDRRIDERIPDRGAENAVVPERDEILHTDKASRNADFGVGDGQQHALHEWIGDEQPEQDDRRQ